MTNLDRYDENILRELTRDGRISNVELADKIGLSPSACLRRVQELENKGVIQGYRVVLNKELLGVGFIAYVSIGLREHSMAAQQAFEQAVQSAPEVIECHNVTGSFEYILRIETADIRAYKRFHADFLGSIQQVNTITTHVLMDSPKDERAG